ncbi:hypothetical protein EMA8858_04134 [Emticicia aquatica]|uniref:HTH LytTR-type domain-containing protein n=2 Tax=Emticicia aquatica TaxID=1681835 RepID=A0ABN8F0Y9_9BACT|nr:hypothetical protein EMA8858_04134 [Emticicia aquatica]
MIKVSKKIIEPHEILYLESRGNYTMFYLLDNKTEMSSFTLQIFEEKLKDYNFYRVNRSQIINFSEIKLFDSTCEQLNIFLKNGLQFSVSRRRRKLFENHQSLFVS